VHIPPGAVEEEAVGHDVLSAGGAMLAALQRAPHPTRPDKGRHLGYKVSKVMAYTGLVCTVVAAKAQVLIAGGRGGGGVGGKEGGGGSGEK
jgi:hypothetical protein